ncbi:MAG: aldose epimerase family protein [bacterium]
MALIVDRDWSYCGVKAVILENELLRVTILPECGAKIVDLLHKPTDTHLLWRNPRIKPAVVPFGANYDDNFSGGWDELFPNDEPCAIDGELYPDHGELWAQPWDVEIDRSAKEVCLNLSCTTRISTVSCRKRISLRLGESILRFHHRMKNEGRKDLPFLWKPHPALNISPHHRIDLPAKRVVIYGASAVNYREGEYIWPYVLRKDGEKVDMRRIPPPESGRFDFHFALELEDGWCALTDTKKKVGFGLVFPKEIFTSVWFFSSYGGWRNLYTTILEPCTTDRTNLEEAVEKGGRYAVLKAGETLECDLLAVVYMGLESVGRIDGDGTVHRGD